MTGIAATPGNEVPEEVIRTFKFLFRACVVGDLFNFLHSWFFSCSWLGTKYCCVALEKNSNREKLTVVSMGMTNLGVFLSK